MEKYTSGCKGCIREFGCEFEETRAHSEDHPKCYIKDQWRESSLESDNGDDKDEEV